MYINNHYLKHYHRHIKCTLDVFENLDLCFMTSSHNSFHLIYWMYNLLKAILHFIGSNSCSWTKK